MILILNIVDISYSKGLIILNSSAINQQHINTVIKSISYMKENYFEETLDLNTIAESVNFSRFHFNRVFKKITGIPPRKYLMSIRLNKSKKLLNETNWNSTDICFEVGYNSLGTFTTKFTHEVGVSPKNYREVLGLENTSADFKEIKTRKKFNGSITGEVKLPSEFEGTLFIGLFTSTIPSGIPVVCAVQKRGGEISLIGIPKGEYYLFAAGFNSRCNLKTVLISNDFYRCMYSDKIIITNENVRLKSPLLLREKKETDPPLILSLPHLYKKIKESSLKSNLGEKKSIVAW